MILAIIILKMKPFHVTCLFLVKILGSEIFDPDLDTRLVRAGEMSLNYWKV